MEIIERPFDRFKTAITDKRYFWGRRSIVEPLCRSLPHVHILLGGRHLGKTSTLRAVEWNLLDPNQKNTFRLFPVFINLQMEQPHGLDHFRYILIRHLREALERWKEVKVSKIRDMYHSYLNQVSIVEVSLLSLLKLKVSKADSDKKLGNDEFREIFLKTLKDIKEINGSSFQGVYFILDEAEFIARKEWANDVWSYIRALKDTDTLIKPFLGFLLAGYRDLKEYQQEIGSPLLNISSIEWLTTLSDSESKQLIEHRSQEEKVSLNEKGISHIIEWSGGHPFLMQQMLNLIFDDRKSGKTGNVEEHIRKLLKTEEFKSIFSSWWNKEGKSDGFGEIERKLYQVLMEKKGESEKDLAKQAGLSLGKCEEALSVLVGTGVIQQIEEDRYQIGGVLFRSWVERQIHPA